MALSRRLVAAAVSVATIATGADAFSFSQLPGGATAQKMRFAARGIAAAHSNADQPKLPAGVDAIVRGITILVTYDWPTWVMVVNGLVFLLAAFAVGWASYGIGQVMITALLAQSDRQRSAKGYSKISTVSDGQSESIDAESSPKFDEDDNLFGAQSDRSVLINATTDIRAFFRHAKAATGLSVFRLALRGGRWAALYQLALMIVLNIADSTTIDSDVDSSSMNTAPVGKLPFDLPATTFGSIIATFFAILLVTPLHTMQTFTILRGSPAGMSSWAQLKSLPYRRLFMPAVIAAAGSTIFRAATFLCFSGLINKVAAIMISSIAIMVDLPVKAGHSKKPSGEVDNPLPGLFITAAVFAILLNLLQIVLVLPARMVLVRAEAAALATTGKESHVREPLRRHQFDAEDSTRDGFRTLVDIDVPAIADPLSGSSADDMAPSTGNSGCKSRCKCRTVAVIKAYSSISAWKDAGVVTVKLWAFQIVSSIAVYSFVGGLFAFVYSMNPSDKVISLKTLLGQ